MLLFLYILESVGLPSSFTRKCKIAVEIGTPFNFRVVKMCKEHSDSELFIFLDRTFVNFDRDLARAYGNVLECTTCKHASHPPCSKVSL